MTVKILYFAAARERTGITAEEVALDGAPVVATLIDAVCARYPRLAEIRGAVRLAVNHEFVGDEAPLSDGDEVAFIPPVSGG